MVALINDLLTYLLTYLSLLTEAMFKLESTGYSALSSPPTVMWWTHTQRDSVMPSVKIPSPLAKWQ